MANDEPTNGLTRFSMHAFDESSSGMIDDLRGEQEAHPAFALAPMQDLSDLDPETAARRHLEQALASAAVPALTAPRVRGTTSEFATISTETVPLTGTKVVKFRQTIDKIPCYGSLITVELDGKNNLVSLDSALAEPTDVSPVADVAPADAVAAVEARPGYRKDLTNVVPRLYWYFDAGESAWRLVYILEDVPVEVDPDNPPAAAAGGAGGAGGADPLQAPRALDYVVDAHSGAVVAELPRTPTMAAVDQSALDGLGVERTFSVETEGDGWVLRDAANNVETYDFGFRDPVVDEADLPGTAIVNPPPWAPAAVSAHFNAVAVSEFLRTNLRRNNIDDRGGTITSTINCVVASASPGGREWHNAFWTPDRRQMVYGQALDHGVLRSLAINLDIVAHEMFHGVTDATARLEYARQSGALNESYSDIFGVIVTNITNADTDKWDWEIGEGVLPGGRPLRDLSDPPRFDQPDHMDDFQVLPNTLGGDWGGVHVNSGIHNKAAYNMLTAEAAPGRLALTALEVAAGFYLALTQRLSRTSQFADSRRGVVASALTLFRALPPDQQAEKMGAIEASFDAVGIV
jgi:Zn-dependent metalloprotease